MTTKKRPPSKASSSQASENPEPFVIPGHVIVGSDWHKDFEAKPHLVVTRDKAGKPRIVRTVELLAKVDDELTAREILAAKDWSMEKHDVEAGSYIEARASDRRLAARGHHHGEAIRLLGKRARHIVQLLGELASSGDTRAIDELASVAGAACESLRVAEKRDLRRVREVARKWNAWPVMLSPVKTLNEGNNEIANDIQLGKDLLIDVHPKAGWVKDAHGTDIAAALLYHVNSCRMSSTKLGATLRRELDPIDLPHSVDKWWECAWAFLEFSYPDPAAVDELRILASKESVPSRVQERIKERLRSRFRAVARKDRKDRKAYPT